MNSLLLIAGTSGTGKSTRVYALIKFLESKGFKPTDYLSYEQTVIGRVYLENIAIIGKEISRQGKPAWQGLDTFSGLFKGSENMFNYLYQQTLKTHVVADSAALLSSNRSRPICIEKQNLEIKSIAKFFSYDKLSDYQERIAGRSGGKFIDETSSMWKNNERFKIFGRAYDEELPQVQHPERYKFIPGKSYEDLCTIGDLILEMSGHSEMISDFEQFCSTAFFSKEETPKEEDLF